jgi:preprotein translocase subunit SecF
MQLIHETHIDFLSVRKTALMVSSALMLVGLVSLLLKGGPQYGIDFLGGTEIHVQFKNEQKTADLRQAISGIGYGSAEIKQFGGARDYLIRVQQQQEQGTQISDSVIEALRKAFSHDPPEVRSAESVGPKIGQELRIKTVWAVIVSLGLMLAYISIRFEVIFAVGSVIALFYNVLMTLGIFSLLNLEISLAVVAAFLTLVGYSINDTIVVFDRIRENLKLHRRENLGIERVINLSLNQTLSRTILTGMTTLMVVVILYLFGGEVIHDFAFCMLVGIIIGTFSSVYIAAPLVVEWYRKHEVQKAKRSPVAVR